MTKKQPDWLDPGERVARSERAQARMQAEHSIVRESRRLSRIRAWESVDAMRGKGA